MFTLSARRNYIKVFISTAFINFVKNSYGTFVICFGTLMKHKNKIYKIYDENISVANLLLVISKELSSISRFNKKVFYKNYY